MKIGGLRVEGYLTVVLVVFIVFSVLLQFPLNPAYLKSLAGPATSMNYYTLCMDSDCFKNWDSNNASVFEPSTADWPMTIIYWGYAEVDKIKSLYSWRWTGVGDPMYMYMTGTWR